MKYTVYHYTVNIVDILIVEILSELSQLYYLLYIILKWVRDRKGKF